MHKVFVNYRTGDAKWAAAHVHAALSGEFGTHRVFWTPKTIPAGADFERDVLGALRKCSVLLALVGPTWLTATGADGGRGLDDPTDRVRREIAEAFRRARSLTLDHRTVFGDIGRMVAALRRLAPDPAAPPDAPPPPTGDGPAADSPWRGDDEIEWANHRYLVQDGVSETVPTDHSWVFRHAGAYRLDSNPSVVRLRQLRVLRETPTAQQRRTALLREATVLTDLHQVTGMPRLAETANQPGSVTLVLDQPDGISLRAAYGPCEWPLDHFRTAEFLRVLGRLSSVLGELHRRGYSHRALDQDAVLVAGHQVWLRDLGLATVAPGGDDGIPPYQAPEQRRAARPADGRRVDVYQVAALAYHVLAGHPPSPGMSLPLRAIDRRLPAELDDLLSNALAVDPVRRPADGATLATEFGRVLDTMVGRG
jgi:serine/threonine protein kinase